jgi:hypothetical protein
MFTGEPPVIGQARYVGIAHALNDLRKGKLLAEAKNSRAKSSK